MSPRHPCPSGYTLIEVTVAMAIVGFAIVGATAGWAFISRGERLNSVQAELDMDVRRSMEKIKRDLRLTAMNKMFFYPPGPGPYTAVSFPMAHDDDGDGLIEMENGGTNIIWDQTVVYHIWTSTPYRLLRTVFDPRDNSLTDAQIMAQLSSVVTNGSGQRTYSGTNAKTEVVFQNLFTWGIYGSGAIHDGYNPTLQWDPGVSFGSFLLTNGGHQLKFTVTGKNKSSSGYRVGIDSLVFTPCGLEREAEAQLPVGAQTWAVAQVDYVAEGAWSGNYQLLFPATATGQTFTLNMDNDRWEETNFRGEGALCRKTVVQFDESVSPKDFIVRLQGLGYAWQADQQTAASNVVHDATHALTNSTVRVLVRGRLLQPYGGNIAFPGKTVYVYFYASAYGALRVRSAFIAEADSQTNASFNAAATGTRLYFPYGGSYSKEDMLISAGSGSWATPSAPYEIDPDKSYVISYTVGSDYGCAVRWPETHSGAPGAYVLPGKSDSSTAMSADWSSFTPATLTYLPAIWYLYTVYPTNGTFTSQVVDTKRPAPVFGPISWDAETPWGTSLKIKVRTGDSPSMTNAPAWDTVAAMTASGAVTAASQQFVQLQAILDPDSGGWSTPKLKDVTLRWAGESKMVDVGAVMTKGPNYGICELTIDGKPLTKGLRIDLTIFEDVMGWGVGGKRLTSSMSAEVDPRNTGK